MCIRVLPSITPCPPLQRQHVLQHLRQPDPRSAAGASHSKHSRLSRLCCRAKPTVIGSMHPQTPKTTADKHKNKSPKKEQQTTTTREKSTTGTSIQQDSHDIA